MRAAFYSRAGSYSRSYHAEVAESEGRCPLTRAKKIVATEHGCTQTTAAAALELLHDGEWHHVGKYATEVAYYDTHNCRLAGAIRHIVVCGGAAKWQARRAKLRAQRQAIFNSVGMYRDGRDSDDLYRMTELKRKLAGARNDH